MSLRHVQRLGFFSFGLALVGATWWGCNAAPQNSFTSSTTTTTTGGGNGGAGGGTTASTTSTGEGGGINFDAGMNDGPEQLDDGGVCSGSSVTAELIQLDMIVLLDQSGSMIGTKWDTVTVDLKAFFSDPQSAGIGAGIVYFPNDNADDCVWTDYAQLEVPIGVLPGNTAALNANIDSHMPTNATPTYGALKGALYAATTYQDTHPTHKVIVVIATDGDPTDCAITDAQTIAALAKSARDYNGVETYVIAVPGSTISNLDLIAAAGGTVSAYNVTMNISQFAQKMADIRANALSCELPIPKPPMNEQLDPAKVNVKYTPGGSMTAETLPNVLTKASCGTKEAWYYDNNANPTKIELCPSACQKVQADKTATVDVLFGCKTVAM